MKALFSGKKAVSHLEMIMSFAIFIIFVILLFSYLPPVQKPGFSDVLLDSLQFHLLNSSRINLLEVPVIIPEDPGCPQSSCYSFENPVTSSETKHFFILDDNSDFVQFGMSSTNISVDGGSSIYYVYYSADKDFLNINLQTSFSTDCKTDCQFSYSAPRIYTVYSLDALNGIADEVKSNYAGKKSEFGFLASSDFIFRVRGSSYNVIINSSAKEPPFKIAVKARDTPIEYLDSDGLIKKGVLNIKVW